MTPNIFVLDDGWLRVLKREDDDDGAVQLLINTDKGEKWVTIGKFTSDFTDQLALERVCNKKVRVSMRHR